ncbi:Global transcription regulator sge1 [Neonectria punicea]|uniref:Transcriptional activator HAP2 n=1 Tax=Neonectria punicea TaxID=979145 RepID=A0ABR1GXV3_9HYPO
MSRDQQYVPCQSVSKDHDAPSINLSLGQPLTDDIPLKNETDQSSETLLTQHQGFLPRPPISPLDQIYHRYSIPSDSQAHIPVTKPAENKETTICTNTKQTHRILKQRVARRKFEEQFGLAQKGRKNHNHESRHKQAMPLPRGPDGRFLKRVEATTLANGADGEGDEGPVNDTRATESSPFAATFQGYINTTFDALIVFEACLSGKMNLILQRPKSRQLRELIQSGDVFVYKEASDMKRWRDGMSWSAGRILDNFLVYQKLEQPSVHDMQKSASKKPKKKGNSAIPKL